MSNETPNPSIPWVTICDAIEFGIMGRQATCREYASLLLERMQEDKSTPPYAIDYLRKIVQGTTGRQTGQGKTFGFEPWFGKEQEG